MFARYSSSHNSNVSTGNSKLLTFAMMDPDWHAGVIMVTFRYDSQKIWANGAQIDSFAPNLQLTVYQFMFR